MATTQYEGVFNYVDDDGNAVELYPEIKTDATLKLSGKAADAAAVGEAIKNAGGVTTLTQAEYDALSEEEQNTGVYLISDGGDDLLAAMQTEIDKLSSNKLNDTCVPANSNIYISSADTWTEKALSYNMSNYKYIGFYFGLADIYYGNRTINTFISVGDFKNTNESNPVVVVHGDYTIANSISKSVRVCYSSDNSVKIYRGNEIYQYYRLTIILFG